MCSNLKLSSDIKLLISDFDGIFTDGGLYVTDEGKTSKKISFKDLMGISLAIKSGYKIAFISGEKTAAIDIVANRFKIEDVHQGIRDKKPIVEELLKKYTLKPAECLYVGDDVNDIEAMKLVEYRITPPNANYKVKKVDNIQLTNACGGDGAFREIVDSLIELQS